MGSSLTVQPALTAEDAVAAGETTHEELRSWSAGGHTHMTAPCCGIAKPLFAMAKHTAHPWWACDWCRLDADRRAAGDMVTSDAELWAHIAIERRERLNATMWVLADDGTVSADEKAAWTAYRSAVAIITPRYVSNPRTVYWPDRPT